MNYFSLLAHADFALHFCFTFITTREFSCFLSFYSLLYPTSEQEAL